jgi:hypothetical protein
MAVAYITTGAQGDQSSNEVLETRRRSVCVPTSNCKPLHICKHLVLQSLQVTIKRNQQSGCLRLFLIDEASKGARPQKLHSGIPHAHDPTICRNAEQGQLLNSNALPHVWQPPIMTHWDIPDHQVVVLLDDSRNPCACW